MCVFRGVHPFLEKTSVVQFFCTREKNSTPNFVAVNNFVILRVSTSEKYYNVVAIREKDDRATAVGCDECNSLLRNLLSPEHCHSI